MNFWCIFLNKNIAQVLKERGAYKIYVVATHGILSGDAPAQIEESIIDEVSDSNDRYTNLICYYLWVNYIALYL